MQEWRSHRDLCDSVALVQMTFAFANTYTITHTHTCMHTLWTYTWQYSTRIDAGVSWEALDSRVMRVNIWTKQIKHTPGTNHEGTQQRLNVIKHSQTNGHVCYSFSHNQNNEFQIHVTALQQAHDKSLFPCVTGRAMWRTLHQAAEGQPARRLPFHCEYHRLRRCCAAFGPPASATYHLCHCHFPGNWGEGSMVSSLHITDSSNAGPALGEDLVSASSHWQYWSSRTPSGWVNTG